MAAAFLLQSRDTVSQPVASTQRPGRIYHADDFAPGLQCRREPPLVASAVASRKVEGYVAPGPAGNEESHPNGHADHGAAALNSKPHHNGLSSQSSMLQPRSLDTTAPHPHGDAQPDDDVQPKRQAHKPQKNKAPTKPKPKAKPAAARQERGETDPAAPSAHVSLLQPETQPPTTDAAEGPRPGKAAPLVLDGVQRDVEALAQCMACDICREVLLDPVHSSTCMHCYCRDCIDAFLVLGGTSNCCPVCQRADVATSLGRDPYKDNLKLDFVLSNLIRKVFPGLAEDAACSAARQLKRSALNAALASQRASTTAATTDRFPKRLRTDGRDVVELFVSGPEDMELEQPYLRVHRTMPASTLARFLADRLRDAGHGADKVLLMCDGGLLDPEEQMGSVIEQRWRAVPASGKTSLPSERTHREIGGLAVWTVTSAKPGNGVELLRDNRTDTYWQSDGLQPHLINLQFQRRVKVSYVAIALDYKLDESYTPSKMSVRAGTGYHDLKELKVIDVNEPIGWQVVQLEGATPACAPADRRSYHVAADFVKAYFVQVAIISNHQNGRDTHVRQIKVFGPRQDLVKAMGHEIGFTSAEFAPYAVVR